MHVLSVLLATYTSATLAAAFRLPFSWHLPWAHAANTDQVPIGIASPPEIDSNEHLNRIAIIGAGAGGSSAAFWLGKAKERWGLEVEVDVFDSNTYVGGRSTTVQPYSDPRLKPIELGASIFVEANKILWRATEEFYLERRDSDDDITDTMGLWDGSRFIITTKSGGISGWWSTLKVIWRYGINPPRRALALMKEMVGQIFALYTPSWGTAPWSDIATLASTLGWEGHVANTSTAYFDSTLGGDGKFAREMIEGGTRVNYGQNIDRIHAFGALVSLAADGASQVKGGNWQIFDEFVKRSGANVHLNTTVTTVTQLKEDKYVLRFVSGSSEAVQSKSYRAVILAAPYHGSSIALNLLAPGSSPDAPTYLDMAEIIPPQPYVHLHVTLLSTPSSAPRARFFGLKPDEKVPSMVITTWQAVREAEAEGKDVPKPEFNCIAVGDKIRLREPDEPANLTAMGLFGEDEAHDRADDGEEWGFKIFSDHRLEDSWLRRAVGKLNWVHRKEWDAYPYLTPTTTFPPVKLANGMYYVNSFEPFVSTMETEALSGRNIVELLVQEHYNASICRADDSSNTRDENDDLVYGFDC